MAAKDARLGADVFSVLACSLVTCFLVALGLGLIPVHIETVIDSPRWRLFVEVCVLRVWPLWTATLLVALAAYSVVSRMSAGRVSLPRGSRRIVLYVNAMVLLPVSVAFDFFAGEAASSVSPWYWQLVLVVFLGGIVALVALLRRAARAELARP